MYGILCEHFLLIKSGENKKDVFVLKQKCKKKVFTWVKVQW